MGIMAYGNYRGYPPMQGGGFYSSFSAKPQWGAGIAQTIHQVMAQKDLQKQRGQQKKQQSFENRMRILNHLKGMEPSDRVKALDRLVKQKNITPQQKDMALAGITKIETHEQKIEKIKAEVTAREEVKARFKAEPEPTQFEKKKAIWDAKLKADPTIQAEYDSVVWGIKPKPTLEELIAKKANPRQANNTWLKDVYKNVDSKAVKKEAKKSKSRPVVRGIALDMPYKYNLAVLNREDRVATPEDLSIIEEYDRQFKYFNEELLSSEMDSFRDFMKSGIDKTGLDKAQIKIWFDIYRKY